MKKPLCLVTCLLMVSVVALGFTRAFIVSVQAACDTDSNSHGGENVTCDQTTDGDLSTTDHDDHIDADRSELGNIETGGGSDSVNIVDTDTDNIDTGSGNDTIRLYGRDENGGYPDVRDVSGGSGSDSITLETGTARSISGGDSNDTISVDNAYTGSGISGGDGDDKMTNRYADSSADIAGDNGNDTILVTDDSHLAGAVLGGSGNDNITVSTSRSQGINGQSIDGGTGNDTVTIVDSAELDAVIDGGDGYDVLRFDLRFDSSDDKKAFQQALAGMDAESGWIEYNGVTYHWQNFEDLVMLLHRLGADSGSGVKVTVLGDSRLNQDAVAGPIAVYCKAGAVEVWTVSPVDGHGELALAAPPSALPQSANGVTVTLSGEEITTGFGDYHFSFPAILCPG